MITKERRRVVRLPKHLPAWLNLDIYPKTIEVPTRNITEGGMLIEIPPRHEKIFTNILNETTMRLEVDLYSGTDKFNSLSKICWTSKENQKGIYNVGVKFIKMNHTQKRIISRYIAQETIKTFPPVVRNKIPHYILYSPEITTNRFAKIVGEIMLFFASLYVRRQKAFVKKAKPISKENIRKLYEFEAKRYLWKHARTTHRKDDAWRLWMAQNILTKIKEINKLHNRAAKHLDIFAGTGLSYLSQAKVFYLNGVYVDTLLVDYSLEMLKVAKTDIITKAILQPP